MSMSVTMTSKLSSNTVDGRAFLRPCPLRYHSGEAFSFIKDLADQLPDLRLGQWLKGNPPDPKGHC
jgi:hypothetical protein